jgi:outer membrane protein TolC
MRTPTRGARNFAVLGLSVLLFVSPARAADPAAQTDNKPVRGPLLSLAQAVQTALDHQPALAGHQASLASAEVQKKALDQLRVPTVLARDLPIRRHQASLGITIAAAGLEQARYETVYAVTRTYLTALHAERQRQVADKAIENLKFNLDIAQKLLKAGNPAVSQIDVDKLGVYIALIQSRRAQAIQEGERARAGLREAMAVGPDYCFDLVPVDDGLSPPCREEVIALALKRRGELVQASVAAEVVDLEVKAQGTSCLPTMRTFAAVVDVHARPIPQGASDGEYRPEALGLEMPTLLAGSRSSRVERARVLYERAEAVVDKTRNLITLEAEDAYERWKEADERVKALGKAPDQAISIADRSRKRFENGDVNAEEAIRSDIVAAQVRAEINQERYQEQLARAALERVTAGGFVAGFFPRACPVP